MSTAVPRVLTALVAAGVLLSSGCTAIKAHFMATELTKGLYAIESYQGQVTERGILRDQPHAKVVKEITYARMWKVRAEVVSPEDHAGSLFVFDGSTMHVWWPRYFFGLKIRGVSIPPKKEVRAAILESSFWALKHYDYEGHGDRQHAGREADLWAGSPRRETPFCYPYRALMDTEYSVPLELTVKKEGRLWYGMTFDTIEFDVPVAEDAFDFEFPEGAIVYDWNLADPGVTLEEAQRLCDFPLLVPAKLPRGHELNKVVMTTYDDMHMAALLMSKKGRWLSLTEMPNMGPIMVPELGIPVPVGEAQGVLNFALGYTIVSWAEEGTSLTLIGNLPYPEMLEIAASVAPPPEIEAEAEAVTGSDASSKAEAN